MDASRPAYCRAVAYRAFARAVPLAETAEGLFRAAWAISQHELPDADLAAGEEAVEGIAYAVRRRVRSESPEALLAHLHDLMFDELGFRGNVEQYYLAANSYLPEVLRTRRGLPITLTLLYRRVAASLGLVVHGVNAPGHFLAMVEIDGPARRESMYVDPFFGGGLLSEAEVFAHRSGDQPGGRPVRATSGPRRPPPLAGPHVAQPASRVRRRGPRARPVRDARVAGAAVNAGGRDRRFAVFDARG